MRQQRNERYHRMRSWLQAMMALCLVLFILVLGLGAGVIILSRQVKQLKDEGEAASGTEDVRSSTSGGEINETAGAKESTQENTSPARTGYIVCLDAGHGGQKGATSTIDGRFECDDTLRLTLAVQRELEKYEDVTVVMTRTEDVEVELEDRAAIANDANADLFVSIHRNSNEDGGKSGVEGWIHSSNPEDSRAAGELILAAMEEVGVSANLGVKSGTWDEPDVNYKVIRLAQMPAVLLEVGYLNSALDNEYFDTNLDAYASATAEAIHVWLTQWVS